MKVIEKDHWHRGSGTILELKDVLPELLSGDSERGSIEKLEADVDAMRRVLIRFLTANIKTVDELNAIAGYDRFLGVKEGDRNGT